MDTLDQLGDDLTVIRDDLFAHYQLILKEFEFDKEARPADMKVVSGQAAFLVLMQFYLRSVDETLDALDADSNIWNDMLQNQPADEVIQMFLRKNSETLQHKANNDNEFRQACLDIAQQESANVGEDLFFAGFQPVYDWLDYFIEQAPAIIQDYKDALAGKNVPPPPSGPSTPGHN